MQSHLATLAITILTLPLSSTTLSPPPTFFPLPTGLHPVGIKQHIFNHTTPNDPVAPLNASNILLSTIYYPTPKIPSPNTTSAYLDPITAELWGTALQYPPGALASYKIWAEVDAPFILTGETRRQLPTVILSPGGGVNAIMYSYLGTMLASNGYTVVALDHPGEIPYLHLPENNTLGMQGVYGIDIRYVWPIELQTAVYNMRISDARAVMNTLFPKWVEEIGAMWNTEEYFMIGHSVGGAAAAGVMEVEERVIGGVNLDGRFYSPTVNSTVLPNAQRPFFMMAGEEHTLALDDTWAPFSQLQTGWWEWVNVTGSSHLDFSDIGDWVDLMGLRGETITPELGGIWSPRMNFLVGRYVLGFLGWVGGWGELVTAPNAEFGEVRWINGSGTAK